MVEHRCLYVTFGQQNRGLRNKYDVVFVDDLDQLPSDAQSWLICSSSRIELAFNAISDKYGGDWSTLYTYKEFLNQVDEYGLTIVDNPGIIVYSNTQ